MAPLKQLNQACLTARTNRVSRWFRLEEQLSRLVATAWASTSTFRGTDKRGGASGARIRLAPQKDWAVNESGELAKILQAFEKIQKDFNGAQSDGKKVSLADLIVLGGCAAVEEAAKKAGHNVQVPFAAGRTDVSQEMTDVESIAVLEPTADGFRNFLGREMDRPAPETLIDRAHLLTMMAPEMTVLVGGLRVLNATVVGRRMGVLTSSRIRHPNLGKMRGRSICKTP